MMNYKGRSMNHYEAITYSCRKTCPVCGKRFPVTPEWALTHESSDRKKYFCSYTCMRAWEKKNLFKGKW